MAKKPKAPATPPAGPPRPTARVRVVKGQINRTDTTLRPRTLERNESRAEQLQRRLYLKRAKLERLGASAPMSLAGEVADLEDQLGQAEGEVRDGTAQIDEFQWMVRNGMVIQPHVDPKRCAEVV